MRAVLSVQLHQAPPSQPGSARSAVSARSLGGFSAVSGQTGFSSQAGAGHPSRQQPGYPPVLEEAAASAEAAAATDSDGGAAVAASDSIIFTGGAQHAGPWSGPDIGNGDESSAFFETVADGALAAMLPCLRFPSSADALYIPCLNF